MSEPRSSELSAGQPAVCSARGCGDPAVWELHWNNPKLHTVQRRKIWVACDQHLGYLSEFLERRGFMREVTAIQRS